MEEWREYYWSSMPSKAGILDEESNLSFFEVFGWSAVLSYYELKLCFLACGEDSLLAVSSGGC